jgi:hypothetical protein
MVFKGYDFDRKTEVVFSQINPQILENLDYLHTLLTKDERLILNIFLENPQPIHTKNIRDRILLFHVNFLTNWVNGKTKFDENSYIISSKNIEVDKVKEFLEKNNENFKVINNLTAYFKWLSRELTELGFEIPSYEKIDKNLFSLEKLGLIGRRYDPEKKAKWFWVINPILLDKLRGFVYGN